MAATPQNPMGTDGFEFVEYTATEPQVLHDVDFEPRAPPAHAGAGLLCVDHLTHNVHRGRMDDWAVFYEKLVNFREIRYFDIHGARLHGEFVTYWNGRRFGHADPGRDMCFDLPALIAHAAKTRGLGAGTNIGSGTVSNADVARGCSCIVERHLLEIFETGKALTPCPGVGDRVCIEFFDAAGRSPFGAIEQEVRRC